MPCKSSSISEIRATSVNVDRKSKAEPSPRKVGTPPTKPCPTNSRACKVTRRMPAPSPSPRGSGGKLEPATSIALSGPSSTTSALLPWKTKEGSAPVKASNCRARNSLCAQRIAPATSRRPLPVSMSFHSASDPSDNCHTPTSTRAGSSCMVGNTSRAYKKLMSSTSTGRKALVPFGSIAVVTATPNSCSIAVANRRFPATLLLSDNAKQHKSFPGASPN
mmetsp:Transcript_15864/g.43433  ORF Transcript_15864/g.43433 Transcript_15864/m.43433 type:complete len:220 (-) Transcript_15864:218-877(-)